MRLSAVTKRLLAITGAAAIGLTGAFVFAGPASAHHAIFSATTECGPTSASAVLHWTVSNSENDKDATITQVKVNGKPTSVGAIKDGAVLPMGGKLTGDLTVTSNNDVVLSLHAVWKKNGRVTHEGDYSSKAEKVNLEKCTFPEPKVTTKSDCDKLVITVTNPADGRETKVVVTVGDAEKKNVTLAPGSSVEVILGAVDNLIAKVKVGDKVTEVKYVKPDNCGPSLPVTGSNTPIMAGGALALVLAGAGVFWVARRRRVRFVAE